MPAQLTKSPPAAFAPPFWAAAIVVALAVIAVYGRSIHNPFIFDDETTILTNSSITSLSPLVGAAEHPGPLNPPADMPTSGRPLVNLSFAVNYAMGALNPAGYRIVNIAFHVLNSLLLLTIANRTLQLTCFADRFTTTSRWFALAVAAIWALHPLQTESVAYVTQRTELMVGFFYLATLYCSLRYWSCAPPQMTESDRTTSQQNSSFFPRRFLWLALAALACAGGMASKEVMVSAPVVVLLFDRAFVAGSFKNALRRSWPLALALACTWLLLFALNIGSPRSQSAGFHLDIAATSWWLTQTKVLLLYLKLTAWPSPLLIHYELPLLTTLSDAWMYVVPACALVAGSLFLLWRNHPAGFLAAWFFAILAPTFVVPIVTETAAERRMYLPLAALVCLLVVGVFALFNNLLESRNPTAANTSTVRSVRKSAFASFLLIAVACGAASASHLNLYSSESNLWRQVLSYYPEDFTAHCNLGRLLIDSNHIPEAIAELEKSVAIKPTFYLGFNNLGVAMIHARRFPEAEGYLKDAIYLCPNYAQAYQNLGNAYLKMGRHAEAIAQLEKSLQLKPNDAEAHNNLGVALAESNQLSAAVEQFRIAAQLNPIDPKAHVNLAQTLPDLNQSAQAIAEYQAAIRLQPARSDLHSELGILLGKAGRNQKAIEEFERALQIDPHFAQAYINLAMVLALANQPAEAIAASERGIALAKSTGKHDIAQAGQEWLDHYRAELRDSKQTQQTSR